MSAEWLDARIHHPFRCLIAGPSESGKSTFVRNLILNSKDLVDKAIDRVIIVLGTEASKNKVLSSLKSDFAGDVTILEIYSIYPDKENFKTNFSTDFKKYIEKISEKGKSCCVVFDDLMTELSECGLLVDLFTKYSSHYGISTVHITQNIFFSSGGKHAASNVTIYRNTHVLVLFKNTLDNTVLTIVTKRLASGYDYKELLNMFNHILDNHRYLVIIGDMSTPSQLKYRTDLFQTQPVRSQTIFQLKK